MSESAIWATISPSGKRAIRAMLEHGKPLDGVQTGMLVTYQTWSHLSGKGLIRWQDKTEGDGAELTPKGYVVARVAQAADWDLRPTRAMPATEQARARREATAAEWEQQSLF